VSRRTFVDRILHLYPRAWRDRYGEEIRDLMSEMTERGDSSPAKAALGLFSSALVWRLRTSWRGLALTGAILASAGGALFVANNVDHGRPNGTPVAMHKVQQSIHPRAAPTSSAPTQSAPTPTGSATQTPKEGPIPPSAINPAYPHGIDLSQVPDFIPTMSNGKIVGYVSKYQFFPTSPPQGPTVAAPSNGAPSGPTAAQIAALDASSILTVYGPDLTTVIGHMYPGQVFVPLGQTPPPYTATGGPVALPGAG
jgi:hypothetical protein